MFFWLRGRVVVVNCRRVCARAWLECIKNDYSDGQPRLGKNQKEKKRGGLGLQDADRQRGRARESSSRSARVSSSKKKHELKKSVAWDDHGQRKVTPKYICTNRVCSTSHRDCGNRIHLEF